MTIKLRPYQEDCKQQVYDAWAEGQRNALLVLPTGAGKTALATTILRENRGASCMIAHRQELVLQISQSVARNEVRHSLSAPLSVVKLAVAQHMAETSRSWYEPSAPCLVAGVDTLIRRQDALRAWANSVTLVIMDEAHHVLRDNKWGKAVAMFPNARFLGVTATPCRADGAGLGDHADGIFESMITGPSMRDLIGMKFLTDYRIFAPPSDIDLTQVHISVTTGDYNQTELRKTIHRSHLHGDVVQHYLRISPGKLGVTFAVDVESATQIAADFNAAGVPAAVVSAKTPDRERVDLLRQFRERKLLQLVNVDLFGEGFDLPAIEVVSMARPTESYSLYCQQFGRGLRPLEGKDRACLAEGTMILTKRGLVEIQNVLPCDLLWDGEEWVQHGGVIYNGIKEVISYAGITATPDHRFWTEKGWTEIGECSRKQMGIIATGRGGEAIRKRDNHIRRDNQGSLRGTESSVCAMRVPNLRRGEKNTLHKFSRGADKRVQDLQPAKALSNVALSKSTGTATEVHKPEGRGVGKLWSSRNKIPFSFGSRRGTMDHEKHRCASRATAGQDKQQWALRTWKPKMVHPRAEHVPHKIVKVVCSLSPVSVKLSGGLILRQHSAETYNHENRRGDSSTILCGVRKIKRGVWDILNSGPRNCFTANGLLTHNCIIDHVGNVLRHGLPDAPRQWTLDRRERKQSATPDDVIPLKACPECTQVYERFYPCCPYCGYKPVVAARSDIHKVDGDLLELDGATLAAMRGEVDRIDLPDSEYQLDILRRHVPGVGQRAELRRHQQDREAQRILRDSIALWGGYQRAAGLTDGAIFRKFYLTYGLDILSAQALRFTEATVLRERIEHALNLT